MDPRFEAAYNEYSRRTPRSKELWERARRWSPLGVHSNYRFLDPYPFYVSRAKGVTLWDADGNEFLDFNMAFGSLQSGHAHPQLVEALSHQLANGSVYGYEWDRTPEVAERVCRRYSMDKVRFSHHRPRGDPSRDPVRPRVHQEAIRPEVRGVIPRLPRHAPRGRQAPSRGRRTEGPPQVGPRLARDPLRTHRAYPHRPVQRPRNDHQDRARAQGRPRRGDCGADPHEHGVHPARGRVLPGVRELCDQLGALLIFDEIKTGAKYLHGAAGRLGVQPDIITLGKSIACGIPLSAIAARPGIMDEVGPRKVAHAGTYNSNPLAMTACLASLDHILTEEGIERSTRLNARLAKGYAEVFDDAGVTAYVSADGVSGTVYFSEHPVRNWRDFLQVDGDRSMLYYYLCMNQGLIPSGTRTR